MRSWSAGSILFVIAGAVIGWLIDQLPGLILGAGGCAAVAHVLNLQRRLEAVEGALEQLQRGLRGASVEPEPSTGGEPAAEAMLDEAVPSEDAELIVLSDAVAYQPEEPEAHSTAHRESGGPPKWDLRDMVVAYFSGGNLLVKVGVVVLFFGVAFLLKYAAEHNRLPIELRLSGVTIGAIALLAVGWRLRNTRAHYGLVLQGGGVGIFYLNVFAALRLYGLLPAELAFGALVAVSVLSSALAVMQDSRSLAIFGTAGGFLAPVLTSTGQGSHVVLFSYYALLNACILGIAWFKAWRALNLVGYISTFVIASAWGFNYYQPKYFATTEPFLILFFLFYTAVAVLYAVRQPPELKGYVDGTLVFGTPLIAFGLQYLLVKSYPYGMAWSALTLAFFYLCLAWVLFRRDAVGMRLLAEAFLALGVGFGTLAIPLAVDERWTASAWALEGAAMVWVGVRQKRCLARVFGMLLQVAAGISFLSASYLSTGHIPVLNGFYLGCLMVSLAGFFTSLTLHRNEEYTERWERTAGVVLGVWAMVWWFAAGLHEMDLHMPHGYLMGAVLLFVALSCAAFDRIETSLDWPLLLYPSLGLLPAMYLIVLASIERRIAHPSAEAGYIGWPAAFLLFYYILHRREDRSDLNRVLDVLHGAAVWLIGGLAAWELSWQIGKWVGGAGTWQTVAWGVVPALILLALSTVGERLLWPIQRRKRAYAALGAGPIAVFAWLWSIYANLACSGDPWPLSYLPVLNPLDIAVGLVFGAIGVWLLHLRSVLPEASIERSLRAAGLAYAASIFLWLNAITARTVHYWGGVPLSGHAMFHSVVLQSALSILWSLVALVTMVVATRKGGREAWLIGAGLMGATVVKLFLIDLSSSGTIERIVSFIGVGVLLLIIGYLSPIPPRGKREEEIIPQ